ncbi:uncharacterized protein Z519_00772 [Cladophialophora bantiana CBS 173.52]|uniref:Alpha-L-arabinofuranosidase 1 catalytic domain-containing protein n=1 Tax=Cladophialophora bantiana (strain ATCC 10958 / CBS 173.52 / CDC B-1940 / NIH 8579) TaxID=1442370 RepID=A0A0D2IQW3_CLAB1|nr:uncharacterized protein Z519_00772 [Cladophialophora bantiana CBS 173.52]KIW99109.1 hypothetical protein Z519_00772 [Cladophialophora bantiana CBS 173.52]
MGQDGVSFLEDRMGDVLGDILNELEYVTRDRDTPYGVLRASHSRAEPFKFNYIEIGNEDWFSLTLSLLMGLSLYSGIKAVYPDLTLISTGFNENPVYNITLPPGSIILSVEGFNFYDNWQERTGNQNVSVFVGEYSIYQIDIPSGYVNYSRPPDIYIFYPTLVAAIAEGVYPLDAERNQKVAKMSANAPSFVSLNYKEWTPNLVTF